METVYSITVGLIAIALGGAGIFLVIQEGGGFNIYLSIIALLAATGAVGVEVRRFVKRREIKKISKFRGGRR